MDIVLNQKLVSVHCVIDSDYNLNEYLVYDQTMFKDLDAIQFRFEETSICLHSNQKQGLQFINDSDYLNHLVNSSDGLSLMDISNHPFFERYMNQLFISMQPLWSFYHSYDGQQFL